jgi:hypothetical protein
MKKTLVFITAILFLQIACKSEVNQKTQNQNDVEKIQALAKKYGLDMNITEIPITEKKMPVMNIDDIEIQFKSMADEQKRQRESNKEVAQMAEEVKNRKDLLPSDYLKLLDKYPLVKQSTIQQQGGEAGFKLYSNRLLSKQDSVLKAQRLKLKN